MMPKNYDQIKAAYDAGNIMDWTNAINRLTGIPIDPTSVYSTYDEAIIYAATSPVAYVNQVIVANNIAYIIVEQPQGKHTVDETEYDIYLLPLATQLAVEQNTASINVLHKDLYALNSRIDSIQTATIILDGGNAAKAEAEAINNE